jgi:hypothetical protein
MIVKDIISAYTLGYIRRSHEFQDGSYSGVRKLGVVSQ